MKKDNTKLHKVQCAQRITLAAVVILICSALGCNQSRDDMETMIKRAQSQFSPTDLQVAVIGICATNKSSVVKIQNLPHEIFALSDTKPEDAILTENKDSKGTLLVSWGGAMASWGIGICPPGGRLDTNIIAHTWRWSEGVFFFYEND